MTLGSFLTVGGGGSPRGDAYQPVYELIGNKEERRGYCFELIKVFGCGHGPEFGDGLSLIVGAQWLAYRFHGPDCDAPVTVFGRSFGCKSVSSALAVDGELAGRVLRLVLWGPSPFHTYWSLTAGRPNSLQHFYQSMESTGLALSSSFRESMRPIVEDHLQILQIPLVLARGAFFDSLCRQCSWMRNVTR